MDSLQTDSWVICISKYIVNAICYSKLHFSCDTARSLKSHLLRNYGLQLLIFQISTALRQRVNIFRIIQIPKEKVCLALLPLCTLLQQLMYRSAAVYCCFSSLLLSSLPHKSYTLESSRINLVGAVVQEMSSYFIAGLCATLLPSLQYCSASKGSAE